MTTYRSTKRDAAIADEYLADHLACMRCGISTPRDDLAALGARCRTCYAAYCAEANPSRWPNRPLQPHERAKMLAGPKAWARRLQQREEAGQALSEVQRWAWRNALGVSVQHTEVGQ